MGGRASGSQRTSSSQVRPLSRALASAGAQLGGGFDAGGLGAAGAGDGGVVDRREVGGGGVLAELHELHVLLEAEDAVVEQDHHDRQLFADGGLELGPHVAESAVADQGHHRGVGMRGSWRRAPAGLPSRGRPARAATGTAARGGGRAGSCPSRWWSSWRQPSTIARRSARAESSSAATRSGRIGRTSLPVTSSRPPRWWRVARRDPRLDVGAGGTARLRSRSSERGEQRLAGQPGVARQPDGRLVVAADLGAVDVDLDERGIRGERAPGVGAVLVGAGADEHDDVGVRGRTRAGGGWPRSGPCSSRRRPATAGAARRPRPCPSSSSRPATTPAPAARRSRRRRRTGAPHRPR